MHFKVDSQDTKRSHSNLANTSAVYFSSDIGFFTYRQGMFRDVERLSVNISVGL